MEILEQSALILAIVSLVRGVTTLSRDPRNRLFMSYFALQLTVSFWAITFFLDGVYNVFVYYRLHLLLNVALAPVGLWFLKMLTRKRDAFGEQLERVALGFAIALGALTLFGVDRQYAWVRWCVLFAPIALVIRIVSLMLSESMGFARVVLRAPSRTVQAAREDGRMVRLTRLQEQLVYLGGLIVLSISTLDHVPFMGTVWPTVGNVGLGVYLYVVGQSITSEKRVGLRYALSRLGALVLLAGGFTALFGIIEVYTRGRWALFVVNAFLASLALIVTLDAFRSLFRDLLDRFAQPNERRLRAEVQEAQRGLVGVTEVKALFDQAARFLSAVMPYERLQLYLLNSNGTHFTRAAREGEDFSEPAPREVLAERPVVAYFLDRIAHRLNPSLTLEWVRAQQDRSADPERLRLFSEYEDALNALDSNILVPLIEGEKVIGFFAIEVSSLPVEWRGTWGILDVLHPYFERMAQTVGGLQIYSRQREQERLATLGIMAAGLAHEIRNPLGAIKGAAQFLDPSQERPESKFLKIIVDETDRLNRVVTQFLNFSKPHALQVKDVELLQLLRKVVEQVRATSPVWGEESIAFEIDPQLSGGVWIEGDPDQLKQVFLNIVQNSERALSGRTDGTLLVRVQWEGLHQVRVQIRDNGRGISEENLAKVFIPFFTTSNAGTGLGLSITRKIVEAHHGKIEVESEEGVYTQVELAFPLLKRELRHLSMEAKPQ